MSSFLSGVCPEQGCWCSYWMRNGPWRNPLIQSYGGTPESVPSNEYWPRLVPSLVRRRLSSFEEPGPTEDSPQSESSVKNMPSRTDFNAAGTAVFGRAHLHVASRTDKQRIVTLGGQPIAALKPELQLQVGVVGDMCSSAGMSSKEGSSCVSAKAPGRSWRPLATSRPLLARTPPGPLKAEAGASCRRLPALLRTHQHSVPIQVGHIA
jgi:hypothetical protein